MTVSPLGKRITLAPTAALAVESATESAMESAIESTGESAAALAAQDSEGFKKLTYLANTSSGLIVGLIKMLTSYGTICMAEHKKFKAKNPRPKDKDLLSSSTAAPSYLSF